MANKLDIFGGTDWTDGDILYALDLVTAFENTVDYSRAIPKTLPDVEAFLSTTPDTDIVNTQTFTSSGTWTKPAGATRVFVKAWGGGGSGAKDSSSTWYCGGGGGGAFSSTWFNASDLGATESVTVGTGGAGKTANSAGDAGGDSIFDSLTAEGGEGGSLSVGAVIALGGKRFNLIQDTNYSGNGAASTGGTVGANTIYGGAGGGTGASSAGAGQHNGGTSIYGGNGGYGITSASANAQAGSVPAGGGGACGENGTTYSSGAGGNGKVIVYTLLY